MSPTLGVVVPARNEEPVLERKLHNLALVDWPSPAAGRRHALLVVDDDSGDATAARARELVARLFPPGGSIDAACIANTHGPGKGGAVRSALERLGALEPVSGPGPGQAPAVELVVLTDADVVLEPGALVQLARAFDRDERLVLACGAQRFVRDLAADGTPCGADGGPPQEAGDVYDRWSARVRALESRAGRLFSVHGQLLTWRARERFAPRLGLAADDLELMLQARGAGAEGRIERVAAARFLEVKTARGAASRAQGLRRARAYFELFEAVERTPRRDALERLQWALYARVPRRAPELAALAALALPGAAWLGLGAGAGFGVATALALAGATPAARRSLELLGWIRRARRRPARGADRPPGSTPGSAPRASDRWEMQRT